MLVPLFHTAQQIESSPRRDCIVSGDFHAERFSLLTTWKALKLIELWRQSPRGSAKSIWLKSFSFSQSDFQILPFLRLSPPNLSFLQQVWGMKAAGMKGPVSWQELCPAWLTGPKERGSLFLPGTTEKKSATEIQRASRNFLWMSCLCKRMYSL